MDETPRTARDAAAALLRDVSRGRDAAVGDTRDAVCRRLLVEIARWIGPEACDALAARALAEAARAHPVLVGVRLRPGAESVLGDLEGRSASSDEVAEAVTAFLVALIELLGRFVGEPMAMQLALRSRKGGGGG